MNTTPAAIGPDDGLLKPLPLDRRVATRAAEWFVQLQSDEATPADIAACARWRACDPEHERAWQRIQQVSRRAGGIPAGFGAPVLRRPLRRTRREAIKTLVALMTAVPAGWVIYRAAPWSVGSADYRTATGEQREVILADGTRVHLNTASAIDVNYDASQRLVRLRAGEILIGTAPDISPPGGATRPFMVGTDEGSIRALGTRFVVRQEGGRSRVTVLEGAVEVRPRNGPDAVRQVNAGEQTRFTADAVEIPGPATPHAAEWTRGMLSADDMPLGEFIAELARHRAGLLRCDPAVADLRISGAFQVNDTSQILASLPRAIPVEIIYRTHYWVTVVPRGAGG